MGADRPAVRREQYPAANRPVSGSDKQPRATLWQMGDTLIALLAARELGLVKEAEFDARLTPCSAPQSPDADRRRFAGQAILPLRRRPCRLQRQTGGQRLVSKRYGPTDARPAAHRRTRAAVW